MKKLKVLLVTFVFSVSCIFAQSYVSNSLMQILDDKIESDYKLTIDGNTQNLFFKDELVKTKVIEENIDFDIHRTQVTINDLTNNLKEIYLYNDGLLFEYDIFDGIDKTSYINSYDENKNLIFTSISNNDLNPEVVFYIRDSQSGMLVGTKRVDSYNWSGDYYLVDNDLLLTEISSELILENEFTLNDDNTISYSNNGIDYIYSLNGQILQEKSQGSITTYKYDEGILFSSENIVDNKKIVSIYDNSAITSSTTYIDDIITESVLFKASGKVKTLYSNAKPVAEVYYDKNNIKVVDIRYFN